MFRAVTILIIALFTVTEVQAQNEVFRELASLQGIQEFGFTVNIEGSHRIAADTTVTPTTIRQQAVNQIVDADIRFVSDEEVRSSADIPFLYMHINMMEMENGLIPFSIELKLYQPVRLELNRRQQATASTWSHSMVGLVTFDNLPTVKRAAESLMDTFLFDYRQVN